MKKSKLMKMLSLIVMLSLSTTSFAENSDKDKLDACDTALNAADKAVKSQEIVLGTQKEIIDLQKDHIEMQGAQIKDLTGNQGLLTNPWFWFGVGLVTGVVINKK